MTALLLLLPGETPWACAFRHTKTAEREEKLENYCTAFDFYSLAKKAMLESDHAQAPRAIELIQKGIDRTGRMCGVYPERPADAAASQDDDELVIFPTVHERHRIEVDREESARKWGRR